MNMGFIETSPAAAVTGLQRQDTAKTMQAGALPIDAQVTGNSEGAFRQMLAHLMGNGKIGQTLPSGQVKAADLVLQGQLALLNLDEEGNLEQLLQSLEQLLIAVEHASPDQLAALQVDPRLSQWMSTINGSDVADGEKLLAQSRGSTTILQELAPQLKDVLQRMITQLSSSNPSQEIASQAKTFEQVLRPILLAPQQQVHDQASGPANLQLQSQGAAEGTQATAMSSTQEATGAGLLSRSGKPLEAVIMAQQTIKLEVGTMGSSPSMLPRTTILRPDLVHLMTGEAAVEASGESATTEPVQMQLPPFADALRSAAGVTVPRTAAPLMPQIPAEQFADELSRFVVRSFLVTQLNGLAEAKIKLVPEQLGTVDIKLTMNNGQLTAQIVTETLLGREALEQQLGALRAALHQQGIQVERLEVSQQQTSLPNQLFKDHGQHGQSARHYSQGQEAKHAAATYEDETADERWDLELLGHEYETYPSSRSFHATA